MENNPDEFVTTIQLRGYLGVDEEQDEEIERLRAFAIEHISREIGGNNIFRIMEIETFNEAVRAQVWLSYYALRDAAKNMQFVKEYLQTLWFYSSRTISI